MAQREEMQGAGGQLGSAATIVGRTERPRFCGTCGGELPSHKGLCPGPPFVSFPKIARLSREVIVTEKIDGTNASVYIDEWGTLLAGARNGWVTPERDNFGFAAWVTAHRSELMDLGPGHHFGEWWGAGIQRRYGLKEKRFSLFNVDRWGETRPACCHVVPVLWRGVFDDLDVHRELTLLATSGSRAAPGFMKPEGIIVYHTKANVSFKRTLERDEEPKGLNGDPPRGTPNDSQVAAPLPPPEQKPEGKS